MGKFHRFVDPSYTSAPTLSTPDAPVTFDGIDYDRLNVTATGTGPGAAAAAGYKTGSAVNTGTYFIAFGEDATSAQSNRGLKALAENTDHLDDLLHRDVAVVVRKVLVASGHGGVATDSVGTGTFVGTDGAYPIDKLFQVLDQNDREIFNATTGAKIYVSSITGATIGDGFSTGAVTLVFSESIPDTQAYRIYYATRSTPATFPKDAMSFVDVRAVAQVSAEVENLFRIIQAPTAVGHVWNTTPYTTLYDAAKSGLNERYRRSTATLSTSLAWAPAHLVHAGSLDVNYAGGGSLIERDGVAPTSVDTGSAASVDPFNALWRAVNANGGVANLPIGYLYEGAFSTPHVSNGPSAGRASFLHVTPFEWLTHTGTPYTIIPPAASGVYTASGTYVTLDVPNYVVNGDGKTSILVSYDFLEISSVNGICTARITGVNGGTPFRLSLDVAGCGTAIPSNGMACTVRWLRFNFGVSDKSNGFGLTYAVPSAHDATEDAIYSNDPAALGELFGPFARFIAGGNASDSVFCPAVVWGYASNAATSGSSFSQTGALWSDGSAYIRYLTLRNLLDSSASTLEMFPGDGTHVNALITTTAQGPDEPGNSLDIAPAANLLLTPSGGLYGNPVGDTDFTNLIGYHFRVTTPTFLLTAPNALITSTDLVHFNGEGALQVTNSSGVTLGESSGAKVPLTVHGDLVVLPEVKSILNGTTWLETGHSEKARVVFPSSGAVDASFTIDDGDNSAGHGNVRFNITGNISEAAATKGLTLSGIYSAVHGGTYTVVHEDDVTHYLNNNTTSLDIRNTFSTDTTDDTDYLAGSNPNHSRLTIAANASSRVLLDSNINLITRKGSRTIARDLGVARVFPNLAPIHWVHGTGPDADDVYVYMGGVDHDGNRVVESSYAIVDLSFSGYDDAVIHIQGLADDTTCQVLVINTQNRHAIYDVGGSTPSGTSFHVQHAFGLLGEGGFPIVLDLVSEGDPSKAAGVLLTARAKHINAGTVNGYFMFVTYDLFRPGSPAAWHPS